MQTWHRAPPSEQGMQLLLQLCCSGSNTMLNILLCRQCWNYCNAGVRTLTYLIQPFVPLYWGSFSLSFFSLSYVCVLFRSVITINKNNTHTHNMYHRVLYSIHYSGVRYILLTIFIAMNILSVLWRNIFSGTSVLPMTNPYLRTI